MALYFCKVPIRICLAALLIMAATPSWAQDDSAVQSPPTTANTVYKSVDSKGQITFTDTAPVGKPSEEIKVQAANSMPAGSTSAASQGGRSSESEPVKYTQLVIASPANDELLGQDIESVNLVAQLEPGLQNGHTFQLYYDGKPVGDGAMSYTVTALERGTHTVEAKVFDSKKKLVKAADPVQFTVRRISALNKLTAARLSSATGDTKVPPSGFGAPKGADSVRGSNSVMGADSTGGASR